MCENDFYEDTYDPEDDELDEQAFLDGELVQLSDGPANIDYETAAEFVGDSFDYDIRFSDRLRATQA